MLKNKYCLYESYAKDCLSVEEYENLEKTGVIPSSLRGIFADGFNISKVLDTKPLCFLENWSRSVEKYGALETALFVYKDFMVIVAEPQSLKKEYIDTLPVAIPLSNVADISCQGGDLYSDGQIYITLTSGEKLTYYIHGHYSAGSISRNNSIDVNVKLNINISYNIKQKEINAKTIESVLHIIWDNAKKDWNDRRLLIYCLFSIKEDIYEMQRYVYCNDEDFLLELYNRKNSIKNNNIIELLEGIRDEIEIKKQKQRKAIDELNQLTQDINIKKSELHSSGLFKQIGIRKEIILLEDKYKSIKEKINSPYYSETVNEMYSAVIKYDDVLSKSNEYANIILYRNNLRYQYIHNQVDVYLERDKTLLIYPEKYILNTLIELGEADIRAYSTSLDSHLLDFHAPSSHDPAIIGGAVSALTNPFVGVATAYSVAENNIAKEKRFERFQQTALDNKAKLDCLNRQYSRTSSILNSRIRTVKSLKCDTNNTMKYFDLLECRIDKYEVNDDGTMTIITRINAPYRLKIDEKDAMIDGSLHIIIKLEGKTVGDAYICGRGFDIDNPNISCIAKDAKEIEFHSYAVGWSLNSRRKIKGIPRNNWFEADLKYDFVFEPIYLWAIEKNDKL